MVRSQVRRGRLRVSDSKTRRLRKVKIVVSIGVTNVSIFNSKGHRL